MIYFEKLLICALNFILYENKSSEEMNNNNSFILDQSARDPRQTGAIPRTSDMDETKPANYKSTIEKINNGYRILLILRGLPGMFFFVVG